MEKIKTLSGALSSIVAALAIAVTLTISVKHEIDTAVKDLADEYCSNPKELRYFVRSKINKITFPHKIEVTCEGENE